MIDCLNRHERSGEKGTVVVGEEIKKKLKKKTKRGIVKEMAGRNR